MKRGTSLFLPLAVVYLVAGACGSGSPSPRSQREPDPSRSILLSVLSDRIYLVDPETGSWSAAIEGLTDFQAGFATWAPDHRRFAYGDGGLLVVDTRTGRIVTVLARRGISMPAWSPDGTRLAYGDGRNIWISPADHIQAAYLPMPIVLGPIAMAWFPGRSIAFEGLRLECHVPKGCSSTDRSDIWRVLPDGTGRMKVTSAGHAEVPKWSPDGSRILFVRHPDATDAGGELWVTSPDGSEAHRVTGNGDVVAADWSPDGTSLAIVREGERSGQLRLWLADGSGANARPLGDAIPGTSATVDW